METEGTLVDSNVILDVLTGDTEWEGWSSAALAHAADEGPLVINPIVFAEVSVRFKTPADADAALPESVFRRDPLPYGGGFLAGKAFARYRRRGGARVTPLPDFYIGAHAAHQGLVLLTRDARRYRTYFPGVTLVAPA
ncbi:type II toxin-antitoxin system VapC family toxin [Microbacterium marinilacus]|uniref:Type II toxin-antitoxin system VapC family toxin n=1 Tax=Microbacterium marinilacus TaxID=415209 RepID=A0ABP7BW20_9MICO|nr:type II toxin-antitoxin system VapC family toxin [Microbacterium marinilacus]MBY0688205.1 type II toxin-antitoxin system VapC family toxin [Microbacterium marinilacus]